MSTRIGLLLSSAGRRVALMECFRRDAEALGISLTVIAVDVRPQLSAACRLADRAIAVPPCSDVSYIPSIQEIVRTEGVDLIVPTIDPELIVYANSAELFERGGALVSVSTPRVVHIARDKRLTAEVLGSAGVRVPRTVSLERYLDEGMDWSGRFILKPVDGSSSIGIRRLRSRRDAEDLRDSPHRYIVQELCEGDEYTVNLFFDSSGQLRCAVPHRRIEVRNGEVSKGRTERLSSVRKMANEIASALDGARGAICFQAIVGVDGEAAVFEVNARFGGGYPLAHAAGATFTRWLLEEAAGLESTAGDVWLEGVTMLRYDAAVFCRDG